MKPKMRIQLLDENLAVLSDRLVDQYTELSVGPQEAHNGPVRLEVVIHDEVQFTKYKEYLEKLRGLIPLALPKTRGLKSNPQTPVSPYREVFEEIKGKKYIEEITEYLDKINFRFLSGQLLLELKEDKVLPEGYFEKLDPKYQYMVRVLRFAKDPVNDKYDFSLLVGIKFIGKPSDSVPVFHKGELKVTLKRSWKKSGEINLKEKKVPMIFPEFMTIEERKHWRYINRKVELTRPISAKDEKFYNRYKLDIKNMNEGKTGHSL